MLFSIALFLLCIIILLFTFLCCAVLAIMWREKRSSRYKTFFYKCWWTEGFINIFTSVFFITTCYLRFFPSMAPMFLYLNHFRWWTKFAEITQEHLMYIQIMNVILTVGGRVCTVCLPQSTITSAAERMNKWEILALQSFLPTFTVIPLYVLFDFQYVQAYDIPISLNSINEEYGQVLFILGLTYRVVAFALCIFGYVFLFWTVRNKAKRNETNILILCGCLLLALGVEVSYTILFYYRESGAYETYAVVRLLCFTSMLWIPFTDIVVTVLVLPPLRRSILKLFVNGAEATLLHPTTKYPSSTIPISVR